jgi:hypothetical protein
MNALAHGGTPGLVAELSTGLMVAALVAYVWVRERRRRARGERPQQAEMRDGE